MDIDLEKVEPIYEKLKELNPAEICWMMRNISYYLVSYYSEDNKGPIYNGSYDQTLIEQATRMQQRIRDNVDIFGQVFDHRIFEEDYFEDLLTDNYYSKYRAAKKEAEEYKEDAMKYRQLCDE